MMSTPLQIYYNSAALAVAAGPIGRPDRGGRSGCTYCFVSGLIGNTVFTFVVAVALAVVADHVATTAYTLVALTSGT